MMVPEGYVPIEGSARAERPDAMYLGPVPDQEPITVTVVVRPDPDDDPLSSIAELGAQSPLDRPSMTRAEFAAQHGARADDLALVRQFAQQHGLVIVDVNAGAHRVRLRGSARSMKAAFAVELSEYAIGNVRYHGRTGRIYIPETIAPVVKAVLGLDDRPQAEPHMRIINPMDRSTRAPAGGQGFTPWEIARLYNFPEDLDGDGQCIGIISLGGNYQPAVLDSYFSQSDLPTPEIVQFLVEQAVRDPAGSDSRADDETMLDIEMAGAIAPKARIVVYTAPNSTSGFIDAITTAIHDEINQPSVISISWGNAEVMFTSQARSALDQVLAQAVQLNVTVLCSVGDKGSSDGIPAGRHVVFPAASPYVIACGGTNVTVTDEVIKEVVWNTLPGGATGGGVSKYLPRPDWQAKLDIGTAAGAGDRFDGRIIPDVAANADPDTGYRVQINGDESQLVGGTSAVAPLLAGLLARINQSLSRPVGYLNPLLYTRLSKQNVFRDVTQGNNFGYSAKPGYDACTGWGSVDGTELLKSLQASGSSSATNSRK